MNIHMVVIRGEVVLTFDQVVSWVCITPAAAREIAGNLTRLAAEAEKSDVSKPAGISIQ